MDSGCPNRPVPATVSVNQLKRQRDTCSVNGGGMRNGSAHLVTTGPSWGTDLCVGFRGRIRARVRGLV